MGVAYATGKYALAECQKCGLQVPYLLIVSDGQWRHLRVCPACFDPRHPQERLKRVSDPIALWRPAPDSKWPPTVPVLSGVYIDPDNSLSWTASSSPDSGVAGYRLYRAVGSDESVLLVDLAVERNFIGTIEFEPLAYLDADVADGTYHYMVQAYDLRGIPSALSNTVTLIVSHDEPPPPSPVDTIFTLKMLDHANVIDTNGDTTVLDGQYGPPVLGGLNTILWMDGSTFDFSSTGYCLAPGGVAARIEITLPEAVPPELEYLSFYIEGDTEAGWTSEVVTFAVGESGTDFSANTYVNVQLIELQYEDYPNPTLLIPATLQLAIGFEE